MQENPLSDGCPTQRKMAVSALQAA